MTVAKIERGSTNVLADLGIENAEQLSTKVQLAIAIRKAIQRQRIKQIDLSKRLRIPQPKVSALMNYILDGFSVDRLMSFLIALDRDVEIRIRRKPKSRKAGRILVTDYG